MCTDRRLVLTSWCRSMNIKKRRVRRSMRSSLLRSRSLSSFQLKHSIKKEKPWVYYAYAPLSIFRKSFFHSGTYNLFNKTYVELTVTELIFKILMSLMYLFVVIGGLAGILMLFFKNYMINSKLLIAAISLYCSVIYPFVFRYADLRYFSPAYPFMLVCALYFSQW